MIDEQYLVSQMMKYIKEHSIKALMELVLKAIDLTNAKEEDE